MQTDTHPLLADLNDDQKLAVTTTTGPVLVVAGPGSGKTRVLTNRIAWLIEQENVLPENILAVTFTNKAANEMRDRIRRLVSGSAADGLVMGTFHSLGVRILRQNPYRAETAINLKQNFVIYDTADQLDVVKESIIHERMDPKQIQPRRILSAISSAKSVMKMPDDVVREAMSYDDEIVARVYTEYERRLRDLNAVDFDDLLTLPLRLFDEDPQLLERYQTQFRHIMVDEYQDTNRVQYVMVTALSDMWRNLFVVGDPDQSIYAWRNADITNILNFRDDYPDAVQINLELNYRSSGYIVQAADRLIRENTDRIDRPIRTTNPDGEKIALRELSDQNHEASFIVDEIRRLTQRGLAHPEQVAVMYRTTAQSRVLEEAFRRSEVPYRIIGGVRFYERKEVKDILAFFKLLYNPADRLSLERIIDNTPLGKGFGPKALETLLDWAREHDTTPVDGLVALAPSIQTSMRHASPPEITGSARKGAERIGATMAILRERAKTSTLSELFDDVVDVSEYREQYKQGSEEDLQRWANVQELRTDMERYDTLDPEDALRTYLESVSLVADVDAMDDSDAGMVTLITLHSAKGLEFPVVFIAGVEEGLLPISRAVDIEAFDHQPMEEERRLFYVGVTRAKQLLYLTCASSRMSYGRYGMNEPSRFLDGIPAEAMKSVTRRDAMASSRSGRLSGYRGGALAGRVQGGTSFDAPAAAPEPVVIPDFEIAQKVFHPKFGTGVVTEVLKLKNDVEVAVEFMRHGKKRLMASLARLEIVEDDE
jgi:DNA helicase-2/ATP-dependent DNA helicase PcrA